MNSTRKNIQKTFGIHKQYKPSQLITTNNCIFRVVKNRSGVTKLIKISKIKHKG